MPAPRLFVSHSHFDSDFAKQLVADLQSRLGAESVWMDESGGLHGGDDWWRKIVAEITDRDVFLVVLSPQALASEWVLKEMGIAYFQYVKAGKKLRPILLKTCSLTTDWELIQAINFTDGPAVYAAKLEELLGTLDLESAANAPAPTVDRCRPAIARLVREVQTAFGLQEWRAVEDKTDALAELDSDTFTAALWQERGLALLALNAPELALEALDKALRAEPHDVPTLQAKGTALLALNRIEKAADAFRMAYRLAPYEDTPLRLRALADLVETLLRADKWAEAARRAEDGARLAPDDPDWQRRLQAARLGPVQASLQATYEAAMQKQRWEEALAACMEALRLAPDDMPWQQFQAQTIAAQDQALAEAELVRHAQRYAQAEAARQAEAERLTEAERAAKRQRLIDGSYLEEQLRQQGIEAVLNELAQAEQDERLSVLAAANMAGKAVLEQAPEEVWNQALGRAGLTLRATRTCQTPRFDLRFATLLPADAALAGIQERQTKAVWGCAFSPDGSLALSASADQTLCLWNAFTGQLVHAFQGHTGPVYGCAFSPDGSLALSASEDQTLRLWNLASGQELCRWTTDAELFCCAFGPDGKTAIAGDWLGGVHFLSLVLR